MKKQYLLAITFLYLMQCFANAQDIDKRIANLQQLNINKIVLYQEYCNGKPPVMVVPGDTAKCHPIYISYLFWRDKGQNYIQRFDECYSYKPHIVESNLFMNIVEQHFSTIAVEKIKPVQIREINKKGKSQTHTIRQSHSCTTGFVFYINGKITRKSVDSFDLNNKNSINYKYNQATYLKRLTEIAKKETNKLFPNN